MFNWFQKKTDTLTYEQATNIMAEFMHWYAKEINLYVGDAERRMLTNIATLHPNVFLDEKLGKEMVQRYFIVSPSKEQRVATRLMIFVTKLKLLFGEEAIHALEIRCIGILLNDFHIPKKLLDQYFRISEQFWIYPLLLIEGNIDLLDQSVPN